MARGEGPINVIPASATTADTEVDVESTPDIVSLFEKTVARLLVPVFRYFT